MKKIIKGNFVKKKFIFVICIFFVVGLFGSVIAESDAVANSVEKIEEASGLIKKFVEDKKGIQEQDVKEVQKVDLNELPEEIEIKDIEESNLAVYQVDYTEEQEEKKVFVLTYSEETENVQKLDYKNVQYLYFSDAEDSGESRFLMMQGVRTSEELGYVMLDKGSITGLSTALEITSFSSGNVEIAIYKNGEKLEFSNSIDSGSVGVKKDFDVQSEEIIEFEAGDVISVKAIGNGNVSWKNVITTLKIATEVRE